MPIYLFRLQIAQPKVDFPLCLHGSSEGSLFLGFTAKYRVALQILSFR